MVIDTFFSDPHDNMFVPDQVCTSAPSTSMDNTLLESAALLGYMSQKTGAVFVNQFLSFLRRPDFDLEKFRSAFSTLSDCRKHLAAHCNSMFTNSGFHETPLNTTWSDGSSGRTVMYTRDPRTVLCDRFSALQENEDFIFRPLLKSSRPDGTPFQTSPMQTALFHNIYKSIRQRVFNCNDNLLFWNDKNPSSPDSFVGFLQLFSEKTTTTLTSSAFVAYPIHVVFLNTTPAKRDWLINNGYNIIGCLPISIFEYIFDRDDGTLKDMVD